MNMQFEGKEGTMPQTAKNKSNEKKDKIITKVQKEPPQGYIIVNESEKWINTSIEHLGDKTMFIRILSFYLIHSPCKKGSYSRYPLEKYGWVKPWYKESFKKILDDIPSFSDSSFIYVQAQKDFMKKWNETEIGNAFYNIKKIEYAVFTYAGESNPHLDLLHHIRNSLAHGRFATILHEREYYICFEDVNDDAGFLVVTARIVLKRSTLIKWIDTFEIKSIEAKNISKEQSVGKVQ